MLLRFFTKCFLKIGNLMVGVTGVVLLALGAFVVVIEYTIGIYEMIIYSDGDFAIGLGVFVVGLAVYGICSICMGKKIFILIYGGVLIVFLIIELVLAFSARSTAIDSKRELKEMVNNALRKKYNDYIQNPEKKETATIITSVHQSYKCCGVFNATETFGTKDKIPLSCYTKDGTLFTEGCAKKEYTAYILFAILLCVTTFIIAAFDVIVIILAFVFALIFSEPEPEPLHV